MTSQLPPCEHAAVGRQQIFTGRDYVTGDSFQIVECRECGLVLTWPAPLASELGKYYPATYYAATSGKRFPAVVELLQQSLYARRVRRIERLVIGPEAGAPASGSRDRKRVLDVGCGPGFLLRQFQKAGWEVDGTELSEQSAAHARDTLGLRIHVGDLASARWPAGSFDAVVLWHVMEHVRCPQSTLAEVARILRPGGVMLVAVPNFGGWEARHARDKWFHLDVPRHLNHFTVPTLTRMVTAAGLQVKSSSFIAPEYDAFSFVQSTLNCLGLRHNLLYQLLRQGRGKVWKQEKLLQIVASFLLAVPLTIASVPLAFLAALMRQGATIALYAQKPAAPGR